MNGQGGAYDPAIRGIDDANMTVSDRDLLRRYVRGRSEQAFTELYRRHIGMVHATCRRELGSSELADDAAQAVFLVLARKAPSLYGGPNLAGWLFQTARFVARSARRQETQREMAQQKAQAVAQRDQEHNTHPTFWAEVEPLLNEALGRLPEPNRTAILLRFLEGRSLAEVGAILGISEAAAGKRTFRALNKLKGLLAKQGVLVPLLALEIALTDGARSEPLPVLPSGAAKAILASAQGVNGAVSAHTIYISEGALNAMKIAQWKTAAAVSALLFGTGAYAIVHGQSRNSAVNVRHDPAAVEATKMDTLSSAAPDGTQAADAYLTAAISGRVVYADGKPAGGVTVNAQIQKSSYETLRAGETDADQEASSKMSWNEAITKPDGTYTIPVGDGVAYNIWEADATGKWVTAAIEGVKGAKGAAANVPDLILTHGAVVEGRIVDSHGNPMPNVSVTSHGPARPLTSSGVLGVQTDSTGHYLLRVAPGKNSIEFVPGGASPNQSATPPGREVDVKTGDWATVDFTDRRDDK